MSDLQQLAELYLALEEWRGESAGVQGHLLKALRKKGLELHFRDTLSAARLKLIKQQQRNLRFHENLETLLWEEAHYAAVKSPQEMQQLVNLFELADWIWLGKKLRYLCLYRAQQIRYPNAPQMGMFQQVESYYRSLPSDQIPVSVCIWYFCLKMLESGNQEGAFTQFKTLLLTCDNLFAEDEIRDLYFFALNYCIRRVNEGEKRFFTDIMDFYKDGLQKGHLLENGQLSHFTYHNIVAAGLQTREFEWTEGFIQGYKARLDRSHRDSSFSFNLARLEFTRKNYDEALRLLQHAHYYDPLLNLAAKTMLLKIYYESKLYDLLESHVEALKIYLRRKTAIGYHRDNYMNLVRFTKKLISLNRMNKKEVLLLREKIQKEAILTERAWLLEQLG